MHMQIVGLYTGNKRAIGPKLSPTGIYKMPVEQVQVNTLGMIGDIQVDKRFHGGPERALHQFSLRSYETLIKRFPLLHSTLKIGQLGENINAVNMHEDNVFIGDIYQMGSVIVQVSSPRIPCWKIDAKLKQPGLSRFILDNQLSGWYYRVVQEGQINQSDTVKLIERSNNNLSIHYFLQLAQNKKLSESEKQQIQNAIGLDPEWRIKLLKS